ncbi:glycosyltransferase [Flavobacterium sp. ZB4R12]|uniref:glycosyltransferase n=1 Tax=Flavobacterium sp. ZB4R12 TaxID=3398732 RepID=UPI003AAE655D
MKKILHLTISSEIGGGPEHIFQLMSGMPLEFESHIACPERGSYYGKFLKITSNRVVLLPHRKFSISYLISAYNYIKTNKIDLLHGHGKGAGFYCRLLSIFIRIPVVHTPHGINQKIEIGLINKIYIQFERLFSFLINAIVYVSKTEFEYAQQLKIWSNIPGHIINNGTKVILADQKSEWRAEKREQMNWTLEKVIITASRFDFQKNTIEFCKIADKLPEFTFVILGEGEEKSHCEFFCKTTGISNVLFVGNVPDPLNYFAAADVYLSTARWEGLSMAILESMAVGLPVVATKVIGNIDLVKSGETGFLYTIGDINEAVKYLLSVFEDVNYLNFSENTKNFHRISFSSESMCRKTESLYIDVLNSKSKN